MILNHLNLSIPNVAEARHLFETYFDFVPDGMKPNDTLAILKGRDGFSLVLMNESMNRNGNKSYPDAFHIGFQLGSSEEVSATYERLKAGGIQLDQEPQLIRKSLGFYFHHQNFMIEVNCTVNTIET
jgi:catechol-2,3-dioxygenase